MSLFEQCSMALGYAVRGLAPNALEEVNWSNNPQPRTREQILKDCEQALSLDKWGLPKPGFRKIVPPSLQDDEEQRAANIFNSLSISPGLAERIDAEGWDEAFKDQPK